MNPEALEEQIRQDMLLLIKLEQQARAEAEVGHLETASELWGKREIVRVRRSYTMRMLWTQHGVPQ